MIHKILTLTLGSFLCLCEVDAFFMATKIIMYQQISNVNFHPLQVLAAAVWSPPTYPSHVIMGEYFIVYMLKTENSSALLLVPASPLAIGVLQRQKQGMIKWMNRWTELLGLYDREINAESGGDECHHLTGCESIITSIIYFIAFSKQ